MFYWVVPLNSGKFYVVKVLLHKNLKAFFKTKFGKKFPNKYLNILYIALTVELNLSYKQ